MHSIEEFLCLSFTEQLLLIRDKATLVLRTTVSDRRFAYYVYANFFVEVEYEDGEASIIHVNAFRGGPKVMEILRILEKV